MLDAHHDKHGNELHSGDRVRSYDHAFLEKTLPQIMDGVERLETA